MSAATTSWAAPELARLGQRLAPYARETLERGASLAARLHADEVSPEHWLAALLADEECAATRAVLHAFADPETIGIEVLAQCSGIMVVGSGRTLPFSVRAVSALRAARAGAQFYEGELWKRELEAVLMPMIEKYDVVLVDDPEGLIRW